MFQYAVRRILYSLLIMAGVLIITFVLFRVAAGDPASTVLGKNPGPKEIEEMRERLGSDKPLFFGTFQHTELYSACDLTGSRIHFPGITPSGKYCAEKNGLKLFPGGKIIFRRNFEQERPVTFSVTLSGKSVSVDGRKYEIPENGELRIKLDNAPEKLILAAEGKEGVLVRKAETFKPVRSMFDTQLFSSLTEVVSFSGEAPYVSFFNFGRTLQTREPIREKLWKGIFPSLSLMLPVFFGELVAGIILAMISCIFRGRLPDRLIMFFSVAGMSISYLVLIIFGQWFLGYYLNLFPVWGWGSPKYIVLPVLLGIISGTGGGVRFYRTVFLNEAGKEYLRTAAAKGVSPSLIYFKHLLKNALIPIITRASTVLPFLFTGSLLLETFFGVPGLGYEGINALNDADLQMLKALVILSAFLFVVINLLTDLAYAWADPRVRLYRKQH